MITTHNLLAIPDAHPLQQQPTQTRLIDRLFDTAKEPLGIVGQCLNDKEAFQFLRSKKAIAQDKTLVRDTLKGRNQLFTKRLQEKKYIVELVKEGFLSTAGVLDSLTSFNLHDLFAVDIQIGKIIAQFGKLQSVNLKGGSFSDTALQDIPKLAFLKELDIRNCRNLTNKALEILSQNGSIETLKLARFEPKLDFIEDHPSLYSNKGIAHLKKLPNLKELDLSSLRGISNTSLKHVAKIESLRVLVIKNCPKLSDKGALHLAKLKNLQELYFFGGKRITSLSIHAIAQIASLEILMIDDSANTKKHAILDDSIQELTKLKRLREVSVSRCKKLTDACLQYFAQIGSLKKLNIKDCPGITANGIHEFQQMRKDVEIIK